MMMLLLGIYVGGFVTTAFILVFHSLSLAGTPPWWVGILVALVWPIAPLILMGMLLLD